MSKIIFRVDSSTAIGSGHVMRCLTIADVISNQGKHIAFFCRPLPGNMIEYIKNRGYDVQVLDEDDLTFSFNHRDGVEQILAWLQHNGGSADWLIVDHYKLDAEWEKKFRIYTRGILAIDDLADRKHDCDILLDQNYYIGMETRYDGLVPSSCRQLLGPEYSLLRHEFILARRQLEPRSGVVKRILVFFGGSDPTGETVKTLTVLNSLGREDITVDVIVGQANYQCEKIRQMCQQFGFNYHYQIQNMAQLMVRADLSIGAGGTTTWERCFLGLPALVIEVAENQHEVSAAVESTGSILNMGRASQVTESDLSRVLKECLAHPEKLNKMSENALRIMGNSLHSGTHKLLEIMEELRAET